MASFTIYLPKKESDELKKSAARRGIKPSRLLRLRQNAVVKNEQNLRMEARLEAIFQLLELLIPEIAYTGGSTRAASASLPAAVQKGTETETNLKKAAALIRARLEKKTGEVIL